MNRILLLACLLLTAPARSQDYLALPNELPVQYGVLGIRTKSIDSDSIVVYQVLLNSPAHRAGVQKNDRIVAIPPYRIRNTGEMSRCVQSHAPGDTLLLALRRNGQPLEIRCSVSDIKHLYYLMSERAHETPSEPLHRFRSTTVPVDEKEARALIQRHGATEEFAALQSALAFDSDRYGAATRLHTVERALQDPLSTGRTARALSKEMQAAPTLSAHLRTAARYLDLNLEKLPRHQIGQDHSAPALILKSLASATTTADRAFAELTKAERATLPAAISDLLERFGDTLLLDMGDSTETIAHIRSLRTAKKVNLNALFLAALQLAQFTEPEVLRTIRVKSQDLNPADIDSLPPGTSGRFLYAENTPFGWLLIGDRGPNLYGTHAAAIIDLGGDDIYFHSGPAPANMAIIIDYAGDDRYIGEHVASGFTGIGLLVDLEGDDFYQGGDMALGSGFCGIGMLVDHTGNDRYINNQVGQGAAFFGAGLLIDINGDDLYSADLIAQGFGGMRGFGLLHDLAGDDHYLVDGAIPSSYGQPNTYAGWGQGVGCGFRGFGSGGIGLLQDDRGNDYYQGGDFAQGVGYFFGLGVLSDTQGNDQYQGSRYAQGSAAHQSVGALLEEAGNDRYEAKIAASQGAGWDAAIGYLSDLSGNDCYEALHLSQGAAAMNGLGVLFDGAGRDNYEALSGQGQGSSTTYWGGRNAPNMGLLIDLGGGNDTYSMRKNQADVRDAGIGLFSDR